jgi:indoleamine 2,3-dioxygenase
MHSSTAPLAEFNVSDLRGFLPTTDPLDRLPSNFDAWEDAAYGLPKLLMCDHVRQRLEELPPFPVDLLSDDREWRRAMSLLSYLGHAYVWSGERPATHLPARLAVPWHAVATRLGRPPVLSYASYCLDNWFRFDAAREPEIGNIGLIQNFLAGEDEEWFILVHVDIELAAAPAIASLLPAQQAALDGNAEELRRHLEIISSALQRMYATMRRMPERCDPYIYYHRVRPYIHGWKNHPDLPEGLIYEGVEAYDGKPQQFRGETGAQSAIVPALDAVLGVHHEADELKTYLLEMREYMPPEHRALLTALEGHPPVRSFIRGHPSAELRAAYDACVDGVERFRSLHLEYAATYIFKQAQTDPKNPHAVGTGGTPFMRYLKKHRDETASHLLNG